MGGEGDEVQKTYSRKGTLNEKNTYTPINPKKYSCNSLKENSYKEFDNEKKVLRLENSPPSPLPYNISNGPSLKWRVTFRVVVFTLQSTVNSL